MTVILLSCASSVGETPWQALCDEALAQASSGEAESRERAVLTLGALAATMSDKVPMLGPSVYATSEWPEAVHGRRVILSEAERPVFESILGALAEKCADVDLKVRTAAILAIEHLGPNAADVCDEIAASTRDPNDLVRCIAARAMYTVCGDLQRSVTVSQELLCSAREDVRCMAAYTMGLLGRKARIARPTLMMLMSKDGSEDVRRLCGWALERMDQ